MMSPTQLLAVRITSAIFFVLMVWTGRFMAKNRHRLFSDGRPENPGERTYASLTPVVIWAHVTLGLLLLALGLH